MLWYINPGKLFAGRKIPDADEASGKMPPEAEEYSHALV